RRLGASKPIRRRETSRSWRLRPMLWWATRRKRAKPVATAMSRSHSARAISSKKCASSWPESGRASLHTPPRILVVDDTPENLEIMTMRLQSHGYEIVTAVDGEDALAK